MISRRQMLRSGVTGGAVLMLGSSGAAIASVRSQAELTERLGRCRGGEQLDVVVPLTAATIANHRFPADRPVSIRGRFLAPPRTESKVHNALEITKSSGIRLVDCDLEGHVAARYERFGRALSISDSTDITITGCRIGKGWQGIWAYSTDRLTVSDCDIAGVGPFGIQMTAIRGFTCRRTSISGFNIFIPPNDLANGEHADAIMFMMVPRWSPDSAWAESGSSDILIEDVFILGDPDNKPQGFFFRDVAKTGGRYSRVTLRNNQLWGTMWNGIAFESHDGDVVIENNTIRALAERGRPVPGGDITQSKIVINGVPPRVLSGNSASAYNLESALKRDRGVREVDRASYAEALAAFTTWRAARAAGKLPSQAPS